jgi:hypothetical protein
MPVAVEGAVGAVAGNTFFAVGGFTTGPGASQVVQRYQVGAPCSTATPTVTSTATVTATASPTGTASPTATGTACAISFSDVAPSDYFYTAVINLACRGVISGYSDGTYRPYNVTTRGQMSKIVALAFGLPIQTPAAGGYTFTDAQPGSTFFAYVETVAAHGIVGGYACGQTNPQNGAAEPCDGANRPYYRPGNEVTRAQLTKMTVLAAVEQQGWTLANPATATFSDVPAGSTFYSYIETAACRGVLGGYSDGTFRPGGLALRGQIAKIVYNAGLNLACSAR